jgi:uncharacterized linocin/CFP29 family protein
MSNELAEIGRQWDRKIVEVLQSQSLGRKLIPKNNELSGKGIGNTSVKSYGYASMADAITDYNIRQDIADGINISGSTILIPIQQDMVEIKRRNFEAMKFDGVSIDSDMAKGMAVKVTKELDKTIIDGWKPDGTNYEVKGFYQVAGNSSAGSDFGTYGNAIKSVGAGLEALNNDGVYSDAGYNLVVAATQYFQLLTSQSSTGIMELPQVLEMLNIGTAGQPGQVMMSPDLTAANGFMAPTATAGNAIYFDLIEAQQPKNLLKYKNGDSEEGDIIITQRGAAVPRFKHLDSNGVDPAVHKFTAI